MTNNVEFKKTTVSLQVDLTQLKQEFQSQWAAVLMMQTVCSDDLSLRF